MQEGRTGQPATDGGQGGREQQDNQGNAERASHNFPLRWAECPTASYHYKIRMQRVFRSCSVCYAGRLESCPDAKTGKRASAAKAGLSCGAYGTTSVVP